MSYSYEIELLLSNSENAWNEQKYPLALRQLKKAIRAYSLPPNTELSKPDFINLICRLASLYCSWGKPDKAEPLYLQAIQLSEQSTQDKYKSLCFSINSLAELYLKANKYIQAEAALERARLLSEEWLEKDDLETISISKNLAYAYFRLGKLNRAILLCEKILKAQELTLGNLHAELAETMELLATINQTKRKFSSAEILYKRALKIRERIAGYPSEDIARLLRKLGSLYCDKHDHSLAKPLLKKSLAIRKALKIIREDEVSSTFQQLAEVYYAECNYPNAELYYKKALKIRQASPGTSLELADSICGLGKVYSGLKKYVEAEAQFNLALEIQIDILGPYNKEISHTLSKLAGVYMSQGRFNEANLMKDQAMACQVQHMQLTIDDNNPYERAIVYHSQGAYIEAEKLYNKALAKVERTLGADHFHLAEILTKLAALHRASENYEKCETLLLQALKIFQHMQHRAVLTTYAQLADLYSMQERYRESEKLFQEALKLLQGISGIRLSDQTEILGGYERMLIACGRKPEADKIQRQLQIILRRQNDYPGLAKKEIGT